MSGRMRRSPLLAGAGVVVAVLFAGAPAALAADSATPPPDDLTISVTVRDGAVKTPAPAAAGTTTPRTTTVTTVGGDTTVIDSQNPPAPAGDERSIGGVLYVSGLGTSYVPSFDPLSGTVDAHFTVKNVSTAVIDSTARFWVTSPFGIELSVVDPVAIAGLKPGESRVIDASLAGVGQWLFTTAHVTLTPPSAVDGVTLDPMTRDTFVFIPPWFLMMLAAAAGVAYVVVRLVRRQLAAPTAPAPPAVAAPAVESPA